MSVFSVTFYNLVTRQRASVGSEMRADDQRVIATIFTGVDPD